MPKGMFLVILIPSKIPYFRTEISGFAADQQTFYTGNVEYGQIVQVTPVSVRLVNADSKLLVE